MISRIKNIKRPTHTHAKRALRRHANPQKAKTYRGFFKNAEKDIFLGVTAPLVEQTAKDFWEMSLVDVRRFMASRVHDERSLANSILVLKFRKGDTKTKAPYATEGNNRRIFCGPDAALSFYTASSGTSHSASGQNRPSALALCGAALAAWSSRSMT